MLEMSILVEVQTRQSNGCISRHASTRRSLEKPS